MHWLRGQQTFFYEVNLRVSRITLEGPGTAVQPLTSPSDMSHLINQIPLIQAQHLCVNSHNHFIINSCCILYFLVPMNFSEVRGHASGLKEKPRCLVAMAQRTQTAKGVSWRWLPVWEGKVSQGRKTSCCHIRDTWSGENEVARFLRGFWVCGLSFLHRPFYVL